MKKALHRLHIKLLWILYVLPVASGFLLAQQHDRHQQHSRASIRSSSASSVDKRCRRWHNYRSKTVLHFFSDDRDEAEIEEEARIKILETRRYQIRTTLKSAEGVRNLRLKNGWVPELDQETGRPIKSDGKLAVTITAFCVAAGAIALRIGGRAALISAVGLDFVADNPELKDNLDQILNTADNMGLVTKLGLFTAGWTAVKVLCFDAGGVALALASGILFGGVLQGAFVSAAAATFGSSVAFGMAKLDTPIRKKALELLEEYPSLRGIEKVVAKDGLKAILTLRLAPVLPIPIGMYNYIYGVTKVPYFDFAAGIFLGSLKPYLLDSYLGYFGKSLVEGTSDASGLQDILLLAALGFSVLVGVFASQLAGETWDSVLQEVEAEKKAKLELEDDKEDILTRKFLGFELPQWTVDFQKSLKNAEDIVSGMIVEEYNAKVWNYTKEEGGPPADRDPANFPESPEMLGAYNGLDYGESFSVGLVLSPLLFQSFIKFSDPFFREEDDELFIQPSRRALRDEKLIAKDTESKRKEQLLRLQKLADQIESRIEMIDERLREDMRQ